MDRGIVLTGGGALLRNLDKVISEETQMPVSSPKILWIVLRSEREKRWTIFIYSRLNQEIRDKHYYNKYRFFSIFFLYLEFYFKVL